MPESAFLVKIQISGHAKRQVFLVPCTITPEDRTLTAEQRLSERKLLKTKAVLVIVGKEPCAVRTSDISTNGVGLLLPYPLGAGLQGQVVFDMYFGGKSHAVKAAVKVAHCVFGAGEFKVGFVFTRIDPPSMGAISEYLG